VVPQSHGKFEFCDGNIEILGNSAEGGDCLRWIRGRKNSESRINNIVGDCQSCYSGMSADARKNYCHSSLFGENSSPPLPSPIPRKYLNRTFRTDNSSSSVQDSRNRISEISPITRDLGPAYSLAYSLKDSRRGESAASSNPPILVSEVGITTPSNLPCSRK